LAKIGAFMVKKRMSSYNRYEEFADRLRMLRNYSLPKILS